MPAAPVHCCGTNSRSLASAPEHLSNGTMSTDIRRCVRPPSPASQGELFKAPAILPEGFRYQAALLTSAEEEALAHELASLPFKPFDFHGHLANRQVVSFGYSYDYGSRQMMDAAPIPDFLEPLRQKIAATFGRPAGTFEQVLINEYRPGAGIGWHRDRAQFAEVVGVSLLVPCILRFRRQSGDAWDRASLTVEPRSAYLLSGLSRTLWEHSIPPLHRHRYSITFRTLAGEQDCPISRR
jgi:alkylated DNA repair dioxygenase AlkB